MSLSSCPYLVRHPWRANSSRLSELQKSNLLVRRQVFDSPNFLSILHKPLRTFGAWRHFHSVTRFLSDYCDTSIRPRVLALTPASMFHLTNPCAEPKGSQPN